MCLEEKICRVDIYSRCMPTYMYGVVFYAHAIQSHNPNHSLYLNFDFEGWAIRGEMGIVDVIDDHYECLNRS